ncbi:MAG: leucine-rich repeat protein [Alistipes sp.]|nr:leucine-rich repeat protein [Alistipes sp.]
MKKLLTLFATISMLFVASCGGDGYDDAALRNELTDLANRVAKLEQLCQQMNTNISSLQTIVNALQQNDYITSVTPINKNGTVVGYTITFTRSQPITIYHGENGKDGQNGKDGYTPQIGVKKDSDGMYYWTLDGEWLTDADGNKIKAIGTDGQDGQPGAEGEDGLDGKPGVDGEDGTDGQDGVTPQLKIENDYWYVSYDNGVSWTRLGKATGADGNDGSNGTNGTDGDSFFQNVNTENAEYVIFTLVDGTQIKLPTWYAFEQLRTLCNQMNTNITSLQSIVNALQNNDYISSCTPLMEDGVQIGYTITFAKSGSIVIYHGKDGEDGINGIDGATPAIGAKYHTDNILYWTINGEWLLDENGERVPVHGKDGENGKDAITPQLKIEDDYWCISYDNGATWQQAGEATGEDGDAFFQSVTQDEDYVYLTLSTGEQIDVPKHHPLSVTFTETEDIRVLADKTYTIGYTITGADDKTVIKALAQDGFRAVVKKTDNATGVIEITTPSTILPTEILVFVTDGKERTIMRSINFVEGVIIVSSKSYTVDYAGGTVQVPLSTNIDYTVEIPEADKSWISVSESRAVMRDEKLTITIRANSSLSPRYTTIRLVDELDVVTETILITQKAGTSRTIHVVSAGSLEELVGKDKDTIEELTVTGALNTFDFDFLKTMSKLKLVDLSETSNTTIPTSCFANSSIATVLLPLGLTAIPDRAFYEAAITSIYIPEKVRTIGEYAFYQCLSISGNLVIPNSTTSIGDYCFQGCTFNGSLSLGNSLNTIGQDAFNDCKNFKGDLIIPNSVSNIGKRVFKNCGFDGKLVIGDGVKLIPWDAFALCVNLTGSISIPQNVTSIERSAFAYCGKLTGTLTIPDKVETIGEAAFYGCKGFTGNLILGTNLTRIDHLAFMQNGIILKNGSEYCHYVQKLNFSKVYCKAKQPPTIFVNSNSSGGYYYSKTNYGEAFDPIYTHMQYLIFNGSTFFNSYTEANSKLPYLIVPVGCKSLYENVSTWKDSFERIEESEF